MFKEQSTMPFFIFTITVRKLQSLEEKQREKGKKNSVKNVLLENVSFSSDGESENCEILESK